MTPQYLLWGATWGNNLASLEWWAFVAVVTFIFRGPLGRLLGGQARKDAAAARQIMADLYEHHVGRPHPAAPDSGSEAT